MDFLNFSRRFEQGNLSTTPVADRRIQNINDENQLNMGTPQRMTLDFHQVSPVHPSSHGKSALLSGARRILPSNKPVETKNVSAVTPSAKHERNHYMKPTEAFQHAVEDVSSTPLRGKKSSHSHRTPASANTPSTLHKTFKKSKPSVTPATAPTSMEHSAQKDRKSHYENDLLLHNDALHTPVRQKSPSRRVQRSESTPPARPRMQAREQVSHRSGRKDSSASVVSGKSIPSYMEPTVTHSAKKVIKQPKEELAVASHSEAILFSPQSLLRRSNSASRLDALLGSSERPLERPVSAPKPRPSPFSFALHTEETKEHAKMEMFRSPPPATIPAVVTPDEVAPPLSAQKSVRSAKKSTPAGTSGFTAEQLSAYKARKRAILAVGSANASGNKSGGSARYAAPTVSAFIRAKEVQVSKKAVVTPPTSNVVNNKLKSNSNENLAARFSSPTRRVEPFAVPQAENTNNITKKGHGDRFASPSLIRERMMKEHNRVKDVRPDIIEEKKKPIDAAKLLQLVDAVEKSVILETSQSSPSKSFKYSNKAKRDFDELSHSSSKLDHHGMSTLTPSHDSKVSQNLTQINNYDVLFESYNESSNILNMSIDESENNKVIRNLQQTNVSQKIEIKAQRSFEGDISSVLPSGTGLSVGGFHQHELLDEVSFQESMDFSSNTLKHLMAPLKQVDNITTSMEQTSMVKESDSMNDIIEESKRLVEENKRVIQTVQERMIKFDNANSSNNTAHPVVTPQANANPNTASSKITLDAMNLSAIEPTSTSPHSFSIGSISTFGEMSAHRRTFSPIKELLRKPSLGGAASSGPSINTAPLPPSIALPNMSRKRSTSIEQQPTPRLPPDVLNLSVISRSNSVHCLPTPTSFGGTFSRSETPLMMFESNAMSGKITPQPVGVSLVRSTSTGANLAEVNNAWATEYINMLQESTKTASITPAVQFPLDRTAVRSSKDSGSVGGIDHRKFSITDSEVEYINSNQNRQQNHSSSTLMDDSGGNDSSNPLNIAMIRSGNSSLAIFSTSAGPSAITLPIANEDGEPFTPLSVTSPLPPPSMTNTTQSASSAVPPMILMPSTSLTNPISLMDIRMSHGENKENMSPLGIVAGMSGSRSPFFPSGVTARTPLQTIKEERGIVSIAMNSSSIEEENENDENQPPLSQLENSSSAVVTSEGVSSSEVELENNTVDNATTQGTSLNEAFLKDSLVTMTSNPSNTSEAASDMMMISSSAMHQNDSNAVADTRSRLFSTTAFDLTITPSKIHQDNHDDEVSDEESDNEEGEEGENEQEDENNDVVLPKQVNTSFELEPRKLSTIPSMIPTTSHHNLPMPLFPTTHHVKALDYESIEKMSIGRSTSMSSGRGSGQRSIGSSVTRSANRRSPAPTTITAETDISLPMSLALPTILPSVPIPPLHNNYLRDQEEEDALVMDDSRRLVDRIEMSDDVVNVQDDESDEEVVDDEANENEERIKEEIEEVEHHEEMMSSSLPYVNDDDDSSMIEMNGSLHSFDANVLLSMSNRSMELPLPSPITTVYQRKTVAPITSNIPEGSERSKISDDGEDAVIGGDVISELIKGICEVESTLTRAEQSPEGKKSSDMSGRSSPVKMRRMMMMAPSMKLLTPTTSDYSLNNSNTAPISISSHPFPASYPTKPTVELSAISSEGMVDRSSTSYTSSIDELATYNTMSLPSLAVDAMMNNIPIRRGSFPSNAILPLQVQMTPSTSFLPDEVDEDEMDIESVRLLTHREEMNPALAPSPHTKRLSTIISPDPVASQLMLNNRRHINDRNIKMMEQTFMTVNDLNNSR